jgi:pyruvate dehydrogenase E2 component (dihydrolipoamide acetyltransferase)
MAVEVILPKLDEAMTSAKIIRWDKKCGDEVRVGDVIVEIETEKVNFEVEAEMAGVLSELLAGDGDEVAVGSPLVYILGPGEEAPEVAPAGPAAPAPILEHVDATAASTAEELRREQAPSPALVKASPLARKVARENGLDISTVAGSGPGGRVERADVELALSAGREVEATPPAGAAEDRGATGPAPLSTMRAIIAERMTQSFQAPHFYLSVNVDTGKLSEVRASLLPLVQERAGVRLTVSDLLVKIVASALKANPRVNAAYVAGGSVEQFEHVAIGLVTSVDDGLLVPVIREADKKSLSQIAVSRDDLVRRARERKLSLDEMRGSTFTLSNMGMFEVDEFSAILQPPEAAILAVGRIEDRAVVRDGDIVARPMMTLTLSIDHRVLDGALGAAFLSSVKRYIENPVDLLA